MNKFWKAMGIAALAAFVPVSFRKDEETGKKTYQTLLISVDVGPGKDEMHTDIGINIGEGLLPDLGRRLIGSKREAAMFTDDPDEAVLFADDEPEAAVVETETPPSQEDAETGEAAGDDFDPEA